MPTLTNLRVAKGRSLLFAPAIIAATFVAIACVYWTTFSYLLGFGRDGDQTTHSGLVVLVVLFLIWNLRGELAVLPIRPFLWGFFGLIVFGFIWLSGQLIFTRVFTQFAMLAMFPMAVLTLLGYRWVKALAFPFFVLTFALPVWSPLVPTLVKWSAKFVELAIRASGVPMYRDGAYFVLPSGSWSIADTCSGVAFLSTSLLLGVLYAWTIYQSPVKRLLFVAGSAIVGVVGNWIRVYLTMMIAHTSDNRLLRDDHYTFGWFLFAAFLFVYCWLGWRYRDKEALPENNSAVNNDGEVTKASLLGRGGRPRILVIIAGILATLLVWPLVESRLSLPQESNMIDIADFPPQNGWSRVRMPTEEWVPEIKNPSQVRVQTFEKNGQRVNVFLGLYRNETWDSKLVSAANQLAGTEKSSASLADRGGVVTELSGVPFEAKTGIIIGRSGRILAWHWYWIDGVSTANDVRAKLQQLLIRFRGAHAASVWVTVYTGANESSNQSSELLQEFVREMGASLQRALIGTGKH